MTYLAIIYLLMALQITNFCTTVYLHRGLAHKSLSFKPAVGWLMWAWLWVFTGINPREWVAVHRKHHAYSDEEGDPHSPLREGLFAILLFNVYYYRREAGNPETVRTYTKDMPITWMDRFPLGSGRLGLATGALITIVLFGPLLGMLTYFLHGLLYIILSGAINGLCHVWGYKNFPEDSAFNVRLLAWITSGEGLHNNHHHNVHATRFSMRPGEFDPASPLIRLMERMGLVKS